MIRVTPSPALPLRLSGAAALGVMGALALAGCTTSATTSEPADGGTGGEATGGTYADGTYTADGSYSTPESVETITVTVTLADGIITDVAVEGDPQKPESAQYQSQFIGGIADEVVGVPIDEVSVSRVAGSSLTSGGFNEAIAEIKTDAAA